MFCTVCGGALPDGALFCPACGARAAGREGSALIEMKCTSCGSGNLKTMPGGKLRCAHCGTVFLREDAKPGETDEALSARVAVLLSQAQTSAEKGDHHSELRALVEAIGLAPEDNTVLLRLGRAYGLLGQPEKALEYYRRAEELYPGDPVVYVNIGAAFIRLGHCAEAREQLEKGIAILEADPMSACVGDTAIAYGNYALCLGKLGDRENAVRYLSLAKEKGYSRESIRSICRQLHLNRFRI